MKFIHATHTAIVVAFAVNPLLVHAEPPDVLSKEEQGARKFSVGGIAPGASRNEFLKKFPAAKKLRLAISSTSLNDEFYEVSINNGTKHPPAVTMEFESGVLAQIRIDYSRESIDVLTKKTPLARQLQSLFGEHDVLSKGIEADRGTVDVYCWDFSQVGRQVTFYNFRNGTAQLVVFHQKVTPRKPDPRPKTSPLGFDR